jgi:hypothetical protein
VAGSASARTSGHIVLSISSEGAALNPPRFTVTWMDALQGTEQVQQYN